MIFMLQAHFLQQIQGGQQMEFIENEIEPGNHDFLFPKKYTNLESQSAGLPESAGNPNHVPPKNICWKSKP
jgi:hypothetical protein